MTTIQESKFHILKFCVFNISFLKKDLIITYLQWSQTSGLEQSFSFLGAEAISAYCYS